MKLYILISMIFLCVGSINGQSLNSAINEKLKISSDKIHAFFEKSGKSMNLYTQNLRAAIVQKSSKETPEECVKFEEEINSIFKRCEQEVDDCQNKASNGIEGAIEAVEPMKRRIAEISKNLKDRLELCDKLFEKESTEYFQCYVDSFEQNYVDVDIMSSLSQTALIILNNNFTSIENEAYMCINQVTMSSKLNMSIAINKFQDCVVNNMTNKTETIESVSNNPKDDAINLENQQDSIEKEAEAEAEIEQPMLEPTENSIDVPVSSNAPDTDLTKELHFVSINKTMPDTTLPPKEIADTVNDSDQSKKLITAVYKDAEEFQLLQKN